MGEGDTLYVEQDADPAETLKSNAIMGDGDTLYVEQDADPAEEPDHDQAVFPF
jgi:hypothetical protein